MKVAPLPGYAPFSPQVLPCYTQAMDLTGLGPALLSLLQGEHSSLSLGFNEMNGPNYQTVREFVESTPEEQQPDWVSDEERELAIQGNSMWVLHWYPDTPVGSYSLAASTLEAVVRAALTQP